MNMPMGGMVMNAADWIRMNCKFGGRRHASYSTDLAMLRDYLKNGIYGGDFSHKLFEFLEEKEGGLPRGYVDEIQYLDVMPEDQMKRFEAWLKKGPAWDDIDAMSPSYLSLDYKNVVKPSTWLVHFSDDAASIGEEGFLSGHEDMNTLGLTTHFVGRGKKPSGWNFAFLALSREAASAASKGKYGADAVVFQAAGVKAYHSGDEEDQIIFRGQAAGNIVPMTKGDDGWEVKNAKSGRVIFVGEYMDVARWVISNYQQYSKAISNIRK